MLPAIALLACPALAVPAGVMHHVVHVESSFNPYAIGVVGGRLVRQPRSLAEAVATAGMLEARGYNFSVGLAQVNRYNLARYGLDSYEKAFDVCPNLLAGSRILAECHSRSHGDWGKAFSCYYSGNFVTGYRAGYVQKVFASMRERAPGGAHTPAAIPLAVVPASRTRVASGSPSAAVATWRTRIDTTSSGARVPRSEPSRTVDGTTPLSQAAPATSPLPGGETDIAVLNAGERPPSFQPRDNQPAPPASPVQSTDTAFVF